MTRSHRSLARCSAGERDADIAEMGPPAVKWTIALIRLWPST